MQTADERELWSAWVRAVRVGGESASGGWPDAVLQPLVVSADAPKRRRADVMMAIVSDNGEDATANVYKPRSRLSDYLDMDVPAPEFEAAAASEDPEVEGRRRRFIELLDVLRETPVLVPLGDGSGPAGERGLLTADWNGVRFILAFSDGQALARYARARGEFHRSLHRPPYRAVVLLLGLEAFRRGAGG
ncbi:hypothetical protein ACF05L_01150 [Streptomyces bobili]|uniref:hypothetical protein n=1 Tax=Streptomyces bobili TaxID=67280 RepID=UPI0036FAC8FF